MAGLRLAACAAIAVHLCLLLSPSAAVRWLSDPAPESNAAAVHDSYRTAYHFQPANNWQNGRIFTTLLHSPPSCVLSIHSFA
jgi:beta-fructofuranosidase